MSARFIGALFAGALVAVVCSGCRENVCGRQNANVTGQWSIKAEGSRRNCSIPEEEGRVELRSEVNLDVAQGGAVGEPDPLALATPVDLDAGIFEFAGRIEGSCVEFTTREIGTFFDLRLSFDGRIRGSRIEGSWQESSVTPCPASGSFRVDITPPFGARGDAGLGTPIFNPDGSVRLVFEDAGCGPPDAGDGSDGGDSSDAGDDGGVDAGDLGDGGEPDAGDAGLVCRRVARQVVENVYPCYRDSDCAQGACAGGVCVAQCERGTDCSVGDACIDLRCEPAPGCGCGGTGIGGFGALLMVIALARRRRLRGAKAL